MLKYLLVLIVVAVGVWMVTARSRPRDPGDRADGADRGRRRPGAAPMLRCAHCGLHLPASDAVLDGSRVYCSEAHRLQGPAR